MSDSELVRLQTEVARLKRASRRQSWVSAIALVAVFAVSAIYIRNSRISGIQKNRDGLLHVRGLVVDDENGHERVRLGAPLPDPMIHGIRKKRRGAIAGVLISDADGNERGGYVTDDSGEAFLTLDSEDEQQVLFLANPKGGVNFDLFDSKGNEAQLLVFPSGPTLRMKKQKEIVAELPPAR